MRTRALLLPRLLVLTALLSSCSFGSTVIRPIDDKDVAFMKKGVAYTPDRDGYFFSRLYFDEVIQVKNDKVNLK